MDRSLFLFSHQREFLSIVLAYLLSSAGILDRSSSAMQVLNALMAVDRKALVANITGKPHSGLRERVTILIGRF